jgi:hypothetical protein
MRGKGRGGCFFFEGWTATTVGTLAPTSRAEAKAAWQNASTHSQRQNRNGSPNHKMERQPSVRNFGDHLSSQFNPPTPHPQLRRRSRVGARVQKCDRAEAPPRGARGVELLLLLFLEPRGREGYVVDVYN